MLKNIIMPIVLAGALALAGGCASNNAYQKAFSAESAIKGNNQVFPAPQDQTFRAVKMTLIRQGFTIEQADITSGLVKAVRNYQDPGDKTISYNIIATADVTADDQESVVTLAASQQTVLHREWHTWWHLLWLIPLFPTGVEYQTVVTQEGNVTDPAFYKDFFASVGTTVAANAAAIRAKTAKQAVPLAQPVADTVAPATGADQPAIASTPTPAPAVDAAPAPAPATPDAASVAPPVAPAAETPAGTATAPAVPAESAVVAPTNAVPASAPTPAPAQ